MDIFAKIIVQKCSLSISFFHLSSRFRKCNGQFCICLDPGDPSWLGQPIPPKFEEFGDRFCLSITFSESAWQMEKKMLNEHFWTTYFANMSIFLGCVTLVAPNKLSLCNVAGYKWFMFCYLVGEPALSLVLWTSKSWSDRHQICPHQIRYSTIRFY